MEIDVVARGQDGHGEFALDVDDDGFGDLLVRNMGGDGDLVGGEAGRVGDGDVFDPVGIEEVLQFFGNHGGGVWFGIGRNRRRISRQARSAVINASRLAVRRFQRQARLGKGENMRQE